MVDEVVAKVLALSRQWEEPLSADVSGKIVDYFRLLLAWNARLNLTGATDVDELLREHLPDSFAMSRLCPIGSEVVDVGSGGGLPAVPFAIMRPDCRVTLVEPRAKRVAFLRTAVRLGGIDTASVLRTRVEEMGSSSFSVAASKATFSPDSWLSIARTLVPGGRAVVFSARVFVPAGGVVAVGSVAYATPDGIPRWAGAFCFT